MNNRDTYCIIDENHQKKLTLPQFFWYDRKPVALTFPRAWDVRICNMEGDEDPALETEQLRKKIFNPVGTVSLKELAKGKKEIAIVVDDLSRPTEAALIVPHLLEVLSESGIADESIRFLISLGCHGAHTAADFRKKLGPSVVERYGVYNHNCYENCIDIGTTRSGIPLRINSELLKCDLKIGIGSILPHLYTGYSGGGKLFLPGMAHIDTVNRFHSFLSPSEKGRIDYANPMIREIEDAVSLIGVDYKIDVLVNTRGEIIDLFAGDPIHVYGKGAAKAETVYQTALDEDFDVVISNAHLKVNEGDIALLMGLEALRPAGGTCVLIMNSPSGQMTHYLMRRFGKFTGGRQSMTRVNLPEENHVIVYSQYKDTTTFDPYENKETIDWERNWSHVIQTIHKRHRNKEVCVGVIPDGTIQYWAKGNHGAGYQE